MPWAVTKMIGVSIDSRRWRMQAAVSNPSISGIRTSRRMTAKFWTIRQRRAARPESASTIS
jgi:hypothetical protein